MDDDIICTLEKILQATGTGYGLAGLMAGASPDTVRAAILTRKLPSRADARVKIVRWVDQNRHAKRRSDLRCLDA